MKKTSPKRASDRRIAARLLGPPPEERKKVDPEELLEILDEMATSLTEARHNIEALRNELLGLESRVEILESVT